MKNNLETKIEHSIRKRVDHYFHPLGINMMPKAYPPISGGENRKDVFDERYDSNSWESSESRSCVGSELEFTKKYREKLVELLFFKKIRSMIDAPCGDLV